jgi:hypothetical protein
MFKAFLLGIGLSLGLCVGMAGFTIGGGYIVAHKVNDAMWRVLDKQEDKRAASPQKPAQEPIQTAYCRDTSVDAREFNECTEAAFPSPFGHCLNEARRTMTMASAIQKCEE